MIDLLALKSRFRLCTSHGPIHREKVLPPFLRENCPLLLPFNRSRLNPRNYRADDDDAPSVNLRSMARGTGQRWIVKSWPGCSYGRVITTQAGSIYGHNAAKSISFSFRLFVDVISVYVTVFVRWPRLRPPRFVYKNFLRFSLFNTL